MLNVGLGGGGGLNLCLRSTIIERIDIFCYLIQVFSFLHMFLRNYIDKTFKPLQPFKSIYTCESRALHILVLDQYKLKSH